MKIINENTSVKLIDSIIVVSNKTIGKKTQKIKYKK